MSVQPIGASDEATRLRHRTPAAWFDWPVSDDAARIAELERGFRRDGLPNLILDFSAAEDIFTRAIPFLTLTSYMNSDGEVVKSESNLLQVVTYTVDLFTTLDGFGTGRVAYLMQRFAPAEDDPSHSPLNAARKIAISRTLSRTMETNSELNE